MMVRLRRNVRLAPYTTFKIGGVADYFAQTDTENLPAVVSYFKKEKIPYQIIAGGSNVVFADGRIRGAVIRIISGKKPIVRGNRIECEAGLSLGDLITTANKSGLSGVGKLAGIPGSVGGAVVGSAGAYGHSIKDVVERVEIFDPRTSRRRWLSSKDCKFSYRESIFKTPKGKDWLILRVVVKLKHPMLKTPLEARRLQTISRQIIKIREQKYRPGLRCPGSFFKNVVLSHLRRPGLRKVLVKIDQSKIIDGKIPTGWLLEQVGAKGMKRGRVRIAPFHGNLFISQPGATAREVKQLARILKNRVKKKFGIELEEEVRYLG